jgi:primosomal protein N' (replication factor Y)
MKIVSVIPLKKGILKGDLTYFTGLNIPVGNVVSIPLRNKKVLAFVSASEDLKESKSNVKGMDFNLKKVTEDKGPSVFRPELLETIFETGRYFAHSKNNAINSLLPNIFIEHYEKISKIKSGEKEIEKKEQNLRAEKLLLQYPLEDRISIHRTLVRESFARGKSIFMVLPTESDIEKYKGELSKGIEQFTFTLYSGMSAKKNLIAYEKIITSTHPVLIIATAPFLSVPRKDIGTIILEHESSGAYKMIKRPHFDLRVFTEIFASKINAKLIFADEMLRFETIGRIDTDNFHPLHPLSYRIDFSGEMEVLGKEISEDKKFRIFNDKSIKEIRSAVAAKKNVFIFSLRKGLATMTVCRDCGENVSCETCGSPLVLYLSHQGKKRMFVCNRCVEEKDGDIACKSCGSWNLLPLGIGTDTVKEELRKNFPKTQIFQLDKESAKTATGAKKIVEEFEKSAGSILVGTEMAFFYFKKKVALSVVASFDSLWSIPNFKMSEKIIHIVLSIACNTSERFIIQTKNENDRTILSITSGNLVAFVREELEDRKKLNYPPFKRFIKIRYLGDKEQTARARKMLHEILEEYSPEIFSGFVARLKNKYVTNALIKLDPQKWSLPELCAGSFIDTDLYAKLVALLPAFEVSVDPEDLL